MLCWAMWMIAAEPSPPAPEPEPAPKMVETTTVAAPLSAEDRELARYLDVLENWELLQELSMTEVMEVLEQVEP